MSLNPSDTSLRNPEDGKVDDQQIPITVVVLTKNEQAGIAATLAHLGAFSRVVVADSNSTDETAEIARASGATVVNFTWNGKYPKKKQWALENNGGVHDWVLLLDADEYPSAELIDEIRSLVPELRSGKHAAYDLNLSYRFAGRFLRHGHSVTKRSLLNGLHASCRRSQCSRH
jgi:glycosyltransferase involved in cell wall biosynthesis